VKVVIPGGSGQVGSILCRWFTSHGHEVVVLSRTRYSAPWRVVEWNGRDQGGWARELDGCEIVVNLAGRSVNCRYTSENRREILESRVDSTRAVGRAIAEAKTPPPVWLQASTATIYAHRLDAANDERTGIIGGGEPRVPETWRFSIQVAKAWEMAAESAPPARTRLVLLRSAIVMSPDRGGPFDLLYRLVRRGLGGRQGDGRQFVSWIHHLDFARALTWLIEHEELAGPVNVSSPAPLPNADFMRELRHAARTAVGLPATRSILEAGAFFLRTETELVLKSRRVVPTRLLDSGFEFKFESWRKAARDLCEAIARGR
jgi:uncharacterized protein (TIGR01777 family)